eukprot:scaffold284880_cov34-Prasinocladus_malaysianus.AAC.1
MFHELHSTICAEAQLACLDGADGCDEERGPRAIPIVKQQPRAHSTQQTGLEGLDGRHRPPELPLIVQAGMHEAACGCVLLDVKEKNAAQAWVILEQTVTANSYI